MAIAVEADSLEFVAFPKIARLNRPMTVTEKIDGTNAAVGVVQTGPDSYDVYAQSRKRVIALDDDNFGFAHWVHANAMELAYGLGPGLHFGEWWGSGIQRGYGLPKGEKRFSLFNTARWADDSVRPQCCSVVPILYEGTFSTEAANTAMRTLAEVGSAASPGFSQPEGIIAFHHAANLCFKATIHKDEAPKSAQEA